MLRTNNKKTKTVAALAVIVVTFAITDFNFGNIGYKANKLPYFLFFIFLLLLIYIINGNKINKAQ